MGQPAATVGSMHVCPMVTGVVPHVGGPILPAGAVPTVCTCTGPPDSIMMGSATVMIGGKPAARMGDTTAHGGSIVLGVMNVLIG
jgi:uncharacterized Zn-binding protein involved in type VI secretion